MALEGTVTSCFLISSDPGASNSNPTRTKRIISKPQTNKLTLYKLLIRPILTFAAPVWSNTSTTNYRHLQTLQSKCLRVIGNYPRRTPIPLLHSTLNIEHIHEFIYRLSEKFFHHCSNHQNPSSAK